MSPSTSSSMLDPVAHMRGFCSHVIADTVIQNANGAFFTMCVPQRIAEVTGGKRDILLENFSMWLNQFFESSRTTITPLRDTVQVAMPDGRTESVPLVRLCLTGSARDKFKAMWDRGQSPMEDYRELEAELQQDDDIRARLTERMVKDTFYPLEDESGPCYRMDFSVPKTHIAQFHQQMRSQFPGVTFHEPGEDSENTLGMVRIGATMRGFAAREYLKALVKPDIDRAIRF